MKPRALVASAPGTNRDAEAAFALELAGADATCAPVEALANRLADAQNPVPPARSAIGPGAGLCGEC